MIQTLGIIVGVALTVPMLIVGAGVAWAHIKDGYLKAKERFRGGDSE